MDESGNTHGAKDDSEREYRNMTADISSYNSKAVIRADLRIAGEKLGNILEAPGEGLVQMTVQGDEDNDAVQGLRRLRSYSDVPKSISMDLAASGNVSKADNYLRKRENLFKAGHLIRDKLDPGKCCADLNGHIEETITYGHLKAFERALATPDMSAEVFNDVIEETNKKALEQGLDINIRDLKYKKRLDKLAYAVRMGLAEDCAERFIEDTPSLFTAEEMEILREEKSLFRIRNRGDLIIRDGILTKLLKETDLSGIDWEKLSERELSDLIKGKVKGIGNIRDPVLRGAIECKLGNLAAMKIQGRIHGGNTVKAIGRKVVAEPVVQDQELLGTLDAVQYMGTVVDIGAHSAELTYKAAHKGAELSGKAVVRGLKAAGMEEAAYEVSEVGYTIATFEKSARKKFDKAITAPSNAMRHAAKKIGVNAAAIGRGLSETGIGRFVINTKAFKGAKAAGKAAGSAAKITGRIVTMPFRLIWNAVNTLRNTVLVPLGILIGLSLAVTILLTAIGGGGATANAIAVLILDSDEDFSDFQAAYDSLDALFQTNISGIINGYAATSNLKGEAIRYGISDPGEEREETSHTAEYKNGVVSNYYYNGSDTYDDDTAVTGVSSNIEDCLSALAVIMSQDQQAWHQEATELLTALYKSTHAYSYFESEPYPCTDGCSIVEYLCSDKESSDLSYGPWKFGEEAKTPAADQECEVCRDAGLQYTEYAGCEVTGTHYHGDDVYHAYNGECSNYKSGGSYIIGYYSSRSDDSDYDSGAEYRADLAYGKENYTAVYKAKKSGESYTIIQSGPHGTSSTYKDSGTESAYKKQLAAEESMDERGCKNYAEVPTSYDDDDGVTTYTLVCECGVCYGHDHYGCPGHEIAACFGHVDLTVDVYILGLAKIFGLGSADEDEGSTDEGITEDGNTEEDDDTIIYSMDGSEYDDHVKLWIEAYPELAKGFVDTGRWSDDNIAWAWSLRNAGDFYELYFIIGNGLVLDLITGTTGGIAIDEEATAASCEIPDNRGNNPVVYYCQYGVAKWSGLLFGGGTISSSGCSITSLAMAVSYLTGGTDEDAWTDPSGIRAKIQEETGSYNTFYVEGAGQDGKSLIPAVADYYGLDAELVTSGNSIITALKQGSVVVMRCGKGEFTQNGHFILLTGVTDDGYVTLNDPSHPDKSYLKYTIDYLISGNAAANPYFYVLSN